MKVKFGMYWIVWGIQEVDLPDTYKDASNEEIQEAILDIWKDIPLPEETDYLLGSEEPDFVTCFERSA